MRATLAAAALLSLLTFAPGCALTSKSKPLDFHYFVLEADGPTLTSAAVAAPPKLGLGHVTSSDFLRNPIVFRTSSHEVGTYETQRWTEYPETYLRRALVHSLFETGAFVEGLGSRGPIVDVELVAFEEVIRGGAHAGRVQISYRLHDGTTVLAAGLITVERAAAGSEMPAVVDAISRSLKEAATRLSAVVQASFSQRP